MLRVLDLLLRMRYALLRIAGSTCPRKALLLRIVKESQQNRVDSRQPAGRDAV
jgi:hypothetical protein